MALTGRYTTYLLVALAVGIPLIAAFGWTRLSKRCVPALVARVVIVAIAQVAAVSAIAVSVNNKYGFYTSWSELLGHSSYTASSVTVPMAQIDSLYRTELRTAYRAGHGTVLPWVIPGAVSGVPARHALVYLPAAYGDPSFRAVRFPVVELLLGFPSRPENWIGPLQLQAILDAEITAHRSVPFVAIMPTQNVAAPRDTQCVNVTGGPQVDTYLTVDVRSAALKTLRLSTGRDAWALMGFSTGGYCAINLALRHPDLFSAAVSLSGYARPAHDASTGSLFGGSTALQNLNTPLWTSVHSHVGRPVSVLMMTTRQDLASYRDSLAFAELAKAPLTVDTVVLGRGGHNATVWRRFEPAAFCWLSRHLSAPLADLTTAGMWPAPAAASKIGGP